MNGDYYNNKESVEEYIRLAKDVSGKGLIEKFKNYLALNSEVLEIGSGPGTDWKILSDLYDVIGSDNSAEFITHLENVHSNGNFVLLDASKIQIERSFDGIYSNKVLHHLTDDNLSKSIKRQHEILKNEGIICHSFWKGEGDEHFKGLYVNYHTQPELTSLFEQHFDILFIQDYAEFEESDSILLIARKRS